MSTEPVFTPKDWKNGPAGGTPISADALEEMETRVAEHGMPLVTEPDQLPPDAADYQEGQVWIEIYE